MTQLLDKTKAHTLVVKSIIGPQKQFASSQGTREKFTLHFEGGYIAEYCPVIGKFSNQIEAGKEFTFRIGYRGDKGDEIEPYFKDGEAPAPGQPKPLTAEPLRAITNVQSTLPYLSLGLAMRFHAEINPQNHDKPKPGNNLSDVFATAEAIKQWLSDNIIDK